MNEKIVPIVFAVDENFAPFLSVTLESILDNASRDYFYNFYVLNAGINDTVKDKFLRYNTKISKIEFVNVEERLNAISGMLYCRDYYTNATYYRFFIPALFPEYEKALYLDSDIIVLGDISKLYQMDVKNNLIGACPEEVMALVKVFGDYVEQGLGIKKENYFNAGVMLMNLSELRKFCIEEKFIDLLQRYKFEVTQDQDYLNVLCKGKVAYFDLGWNKCPLPNENFDDNDIKLIHYKLYYKPWLYKEIKYGEQFWRYAKNCPFYDKIIAISQSYNEENVVRDLFAYKRLMKMASDYLKNDYNYFNTVVKTKNAI